MSDKTSRGRLCRPTEALLTTVGVRCALEAVAVEEHPLERAGIAERVLKLLVLPLVLGQGDFPCRC